MKATPDQTWPMYLNADQYEIISTIMLWNMVAPGTKWRIDPKHPERIGPKDARRINALMEAVRNVRAQAALFAGQRCLELIRGSSTVSEAAQSVGEIIGSVGDTAESEQEGERG